MKRLITSFFLVFILAAFTVNAQDSDGITQYKEGNFKKAASTLKKEVKNDRSNARLWNFLGLAQLKSGKIRDGQKSFMMAASLDSENVDYLTNLANVYVQLQQWDMVIREATVALSLEPANSNALANRSRAYWNQEKHIEALRDTADLIKNEPTNPIGYFLSSEIMLSRYTTTEKLPKEERLEFLIASTQVLEKCVQVCVGEKEAIEKRANDQLEFLKYFSENADIGDEGELECKPLKILSKPFPGYTASARRNSTSGTVKLRVIFNADGKIGPVLVLMRLPNGLTEQSVAAAQAIKFRPEVCGGIPVAVSKTVTFRFSIF